MASNDRATIRMQLIGARQVVAGLGETTAASERLTGATRAQGRAALFASERTWLQNQALFTLRRYAYGGTLALTALVGEMVHWGYQFDQTMQSSRVALRPVFHDTQALNREMLYLFNFTKYTPFQFRDMTVAFRQMYGAMRPLGITAGQVNFYIKAMVDALSFTGRTSPGALNRVAVALQHVAFLGHLTGQSLLQLARDGLPVYAALQKELGLTSDQMHNIGKLGVPAQTALEAITKYIETTPGFANAARKQAERTLSGMLTTLKDNVSQVMGSLMIGGQGGAMGFVRSLNRTFDQVTNVITRRGGKIGINQVMQIFESNYPWLRGFFTALRLVGLYARTAAMIFRNSVWPAIHDVAVAATPLVILLFGIGHAMAFLGRHGLLLRIIITYLLAVWVAERTILAIVWLWKLKNAMMDLFLARTAAILTARQAVLNWVQLIQAVRLREITALQALEFLRMTRLIRVMTTMTGVWQVLTKGYIRGANGQFLALTRLEKMARAVRLAYLGAGGGIRGFIAVLGLARVAVWEFLASVPIVGWALLLITVLGIMYWRWKAFRDLVNRSIMWLYDHPLVALFVPVIGPLIVMVRLIRHFAQILHDIYNTARHPLRLFGGLGFGLPHGVRGWARALTGGMIPGLATGGIVSHAGAFLVGERGPELAVLPAGAAVSPISASVAGMGSFAGSLDLTVINKTYLDGKKIAERISKHKLDTGARK